jgi:hypothetical protein
MTGPDTNRDTDLARIDEALADSRATAEDPRERELQELALTLRADSPEPEPRFAREMDERVEEGFPRPRRRLLGVALPSGRLLPAMGVAAMLIAVAVVAFNGLRGDSRSTSVSPSSGAQDQAARPDAQGPLNGIIEGDQPSQTPAPGDEAATGAGRRVERTAQLRLAAPEPKMQSVAEQIGVVAERYHGYVLRSDITTGEENAGGSFQLRVPTDRLQAALADLSKLGDVRARSETGQDLTAPFRETESKLGQALIERTALRAQLRSAKGSKADALRVRLRVLAAQIDDLSGRMGELKRRTVYSTVTVVLEQKQGGAPAGGKDQDDGSIGAAFDDAVGTLGDFATFLVRALGVLIPLGIALVAGLVGLRLVRRRRREAALF